MHDNVSFLTFIASSVEDGGINVLHEVCNDILQYRFPLDTQTLQYEILEKIKKKVIIIIGTIVGTIIFAFETYFKIINQ